MTFIYDCLHHMNAQLFHCFHCNLLMRKMFFIIIEFKLLIFHIWVQTTFAFLFIYVWHSSRVAK